MELRKEHAEGQAHGGHGEDAGRVVPSHHDGHVLMGL